VGEYAGVLEITRGCGIRVEIRRFALRIVGGDECIIVQKIQCSNTELTTTKIAPVS